MARHRRPPNRRAQISAAVVVVVAVVVAIIAFAGRGENSAPIARQSQAPQPPAHTSPPPPTGVATPRPGTTPGSPSNASATRPVRISIPLIHVDAAVVPVTTGSLGVLLAPSDLKTVGWYSAGGPPAVAGTAFLTARASATRQPGLFERLRYLPRGAVVSITDASERERVFRVTARKTVARTDPRSILLSVGAPRTGERQVVLLAVPVAAAQLRPAANVVVVASR